MRLPAAASIGLFAAAACFGEDRPPPLGDLVGSGGSAGGGGEAGGPLPGGFLDAGTFDGPPAPDALGLCGNEIIPVIIDRPNLYWVVDRSGSMQAPLPGSPFSKYENARIAIGDVLRAIGHRVNVGAAVFPSPANPSPQCGPGDEVFGTRPGDPIGAMTGRDGPVLNSLLATLAGFGAIGGTPITSTLVTLTPTLTALEGDTAVILATDGAPNCNFDAMCGPELCMPNMSGVVIGGEQCSPSFNCCDPALVVDGPADCLDADPAKDAVQTLTDSGIKTYVVGMPGSEQFASLLDELAVIGGTARSELPRYYTVTGTDDLSDTLLEIGADIAISCTFELATEPPDPNDVNVYFDTKVLGSDPIDGWSYTDATTVQINGAACATLKSGRVGQVQIVAGCPTEVL